MHLRMLRNVLITFAAFHPDIGYAQGMNDIAGRFLSVLDSEVCSMRSCILSCRVDNSSMRS